MKKLLIIPCLLLASCCATPTAAIDAAAVEPLWNIVIKRYTAMVTERTMPETQKTAWLLDATLLTKVLQAALSQAPAAVAE